MWWCTRLFVHQSLHCVALYCTALHFTTLHLPHYVTLHKHHITQLKETALSFWESLLFGFSGGDQRHALVGWAVGLKALCILNGPFGSSWQSRETLLVSGRCCSSCLKCNLASCGPRKVSRFGRWFRCRFVYSLVSSDQRSELRERHQVWRLVARVLCGAGC